MHWYWMALYILFWVSLAMYVVEVFVLGGNSRVAMTSVQKGCHTWLNLLMIFAMVAVLWIAAAATALVWPVGIPWQARRLYKMFHAKLKPIH